MVMDIKSGSMFIAVQEYDGKYRHSLYCSFHAQAFLSIVNFSVVRCLSVLVDLIFLCSTANYLNFLLLALKSASMLRIKC